ncbi:M20 family metallopeptidase [Gordonia desulfuricans]|uniref:Probable succinyl-diaminopimelate desuccinylase n=1 Tax=Gordonia desulfuricans TaxID=89051 RepID=A0A7K3LKV0_9ACTN|nr:M20 family metallopeptidase [Gordonia desulfuricans]NDK88167.1 M20 family metallopeptidase [Gordonia desulfuricans]
MNGSAGDNGVGTVDVGAVDVTTVLGLTRDLVRIASTNPPGHERAVAEHLCGVLDRLGLDPEIIEDGAGRASVIASTASDSGVGGSDRKPVLLVNGHIDTVPADPSRWRHDPWGAEVVDGRLYGRGATDMKGGVAASIAALIHCRQVGIELPCDITFHFVADEELGGRHGTAYLLDQQLIHADAAIVPEPTSLMLCIAERGLMFARITTHGIPAHGSEPSRGRSAIVAAAHITDVLHGRTFAGSAEHPLLGRTTCNVGMINGGIGPNVVAERCVLEVDRRAVPGDTAESLLDGLRRGIATAGVSTDDYDIEVTTYCEPSEISPDNEFVGLVADAAASVLGVTPTFTGLPFTTDARFMRNQLGIPTVVFGPGDLSLAHVVDEYVEVEDLVSATAVMARIYSCFTASKHLHHT